MYLSLLNFIHLKHTAHLTMGQAPLIQVLFPDKRLCTFLSHGAYIVRLIKGKYSINICQTMYNIIINSFIRYIQGFIFFHSLFQLFLALPTQTFTRSISIQTVCSPIYPKALFFSTYHFMVVVLRRQGKNTDGLCRLSVSRFARTRSDPQTGAMN